MALDPVLFSDWEHRHMMRLPRQGQWVAAMSRRATVEGEPVYFAGVCTLVWWSMDQPCIDLANSRGTYRIQPELGDEFRIVDEEMFE